MRFMRVVSLIAGITLLATGFAALVGRRAQLGADRDRQLEATAELLTSQLDETVARITAVLAIATTSTDVRLLGDVLGLPVCAVVEGSDPAECGGPGEPDGDGAAAALAATAESGAPIAVVAPPSSGAPATEVVVAVDQGVRRIVAGVTLETEALPPGTGAGLVPVAGEPLLRPHPDGDDRAYARPSTVEFDDGPWAVRTWSDPDVQLTAEERWLFGAQLAVGSLLAVVALGAMVADHRTLHRRATTDALTHLPNRAEFERRAAELLARLGRDGGRACLLVIDLDRFKTVNDSIGHDGGDRVLVAAADRLRAAVRESDLVGRWGGDEFVVLMPGIGDARSVPDRAAMVAKAIADAPAVGGHELTASVGASLFPVHGDTLEDLLRAADRAMYAAKLQGGPVLSW